MEDIPTETLADMLRTMQMIRSFELRMQDVIRERGRMGEFQGALHSCEGQEAISAGLGAQLRKDDYVFSTHRGHGHALAKKAPLKKVVAELLGKETGVSHGRGGSMHLFSPEIGLMGGNGIVGGGIPLALGTAYSSVSRGTDQITVCFFGDGGASQGCFHESVNMAALMKLPVVYVCENNLYAATTHFSVNSSIENIGDRAAGYGIPGHVIDGNDVLTVYATGGEAFSRARAGQGPTLIECKTYRHRTHCMVIPEHRGKQETELWKSRDPIPRFEQRLIESGAITREEIETMRAEVGECLEEAVEFAKKSPEPRPETATQNVWAD